MTGKEAIHYVRTLRLDQVKALMNRERKAPNPTLLRVCAWRVKDPEGWRALLTEMGLIDCPPTRTEVDAVQLWRTKHWTEEELAEATGLSAKTIGVLRRTTLRDETWSYRTVGHYQKAYRLMGDEVKL